MHASDLWNVRRLLPVGVALVLGGVAAGAPGKGGSGKAKGGAAVAKEGKVEKAAKPGPVAKVGETRVAERKVAPLLLDEVLAAVMKRYPPWLAALIEQDIATGRLRQTLGAFDPSVSAKLGLQRGYYGAESGGAMLEQALPFWGGSVYGGYRLTGGLLPNYSKERTQEDGEFTVGARLNLLRDGAIDRRRATVQQARIDVELADPFILRQYLDFVRAAARAYWNWVASGMRLRISEEILRVAEERDGLLAAQITEGLVAPIVRTDNRQLVLSRSIEVVRAQRRLEAAAIELSLFLRGEDDVPVVVSRERVPDGFPVAVAPDEKRTAVDLLNASVRRPELRRIQLTMDKLVVDERLARNNLLPNLDIGVSAAREFGDQPYKDIDRTELQAGIELKIPLGRNEAKGRLETINAQMERLKREAQFARDRITAEVRDASSALEAAWSLIGQNRSNVELAAELEKAEWYRFEEGASDMLAVQLREQRTFESRLSEVESVADYFRAVAEYRASVAADAPAVGK